MKFIIINVREWAITGFLFFGSRLWSSFDSPKLFLSDCTLNSPSNNNNTFNGWIHKGWIKHPFNDEKLNLCKSSRAHCELSAIQKYAKKGRKNIIKNTPSILWRSMYWHYSHSKWVNEPVSRQMNNNNDNTKIWHKGQTEHMKLNKIKIKIKNANTNVLR